MRLKTMIAAIGASAIALAPLPLLAQVEEEEAAGVLLGGRSGAFIIPLFSVAAVLGGIAIAAGGGNDETRPTSP